MFDLVTGVRSFGRHIALAGVTAGSTIIGMSAASAGSCPSDKVKADARQAVTYAAKGVTDTCSPPSISKRNRPTSRSVSFGSASSP